MAELIFWISTVTLIYTYIGYAAWCAVLAGLFPVKRIIRDIYPSLTLIIPCYNEERVIRDKISNTLGLAYPRDKLQVIIASESTDETNTIANGFTESGIELIAFGQRRGKSALISSVMPRARGEIIAFSDANIELKKDALEMLARNFADPRVGAVAGVVCVTNPGVSSISWSEAVYKRYENFLRTANSRRGHLLNPDGALFAVRKGLYRPISADRSDDFELVIRVLLQKYLSVLEPAAIAYENAATTSHAEIQRKVRMVSWFLTSAVILCTEAFFARQPGLILQIISHKFYRWFTPVFLITLFLSSASLWAHGVLYQLTVIIYLIILLFAAAGWYIGERQKRKPPLLLKASLYILIFNYAFLAGIIKCLSRGQRSSTWDKTRE